jgi:hypothetical protein
MRKCKECGTRWMACPSCGNPVFCIECDSCLSCSYKVVSLARVTPQTNPRKANRLNERRKAKLRPEVRAKING